VKIERNQKINIEEVDCLFHSVHWVGSPIFRKDRGSNTKKRREQRRDRREERRKWEREFTGWH